jgi:hypothetical protein
MMPVDLLFGDILKYPHDTKRRPMSHHSLRLPPWHNIAGFFYWFQTGGEHLNTKWWGSINYRVLFSNLTHRSGWLFGDEGTFTESRSTFDFILKVDST